MSNDYDILIDAFIPIAIISIMLLVFFAPFIVFGYWEYQESVFKIEACKSSQNIAQCLKDIQ